MGAIAGLGSGAHQLRAHRLLALVVLNILVFISGIVVSPLPGVRLMSFLVVVVTERFDFGSLVTICACIFLRVLICPLNS